MRSGVAVAAAVVLTGLFLTSAEADPITPGCLAAPSETCFKPNQVATGTASNSDFPFLIVETTDKLPIGGNPTVNITFQASKEEPTEFISQVFLNLNPTIDPTALLFAFNGSTVDPSGGTPTSLSDINIFAEANGRSPSPGETNMFDLEFRFPTAGGPNERRLNNFDRVQLLASCSLSLDPDCAGFDALAFNFLSVNKQSGLPDANSFRICEHEQGITTGEGSGKICGRASATGREVPNPSTLILFGVALVTLGRLQARIRPQSFLRSQ
jgi:hypothetical protein